MKSLVERLASSYIEVSVLFNMVANFSIDNLDISPCNTTQDTTRACSEGFYLENTSQTIACTPLCNFWISASEFTSAEDVIFVISMFVAIVVSVILFIVALWFQRDAM